MLRRLSVLVLSAAFAGSAVGSADVPLKPFALPANGAGEDGFALEINVPLARRVALAPADVEDASFTVVLQAASPDGAAPPVRLDVLDGNAPLWSAPLAPVRGRGRFVAKFSDGVAQALRRWLEAGGEPVRVRCVARDAAGAAVAAEADGAIEGTMFVAEHPKHLLFAAPAKIVPGVYATMRDGRLFYGGRRLRLWSQVMDGTGARYRQLGFNGWRAWFQTDFYSPQSAVAGRAMDFEKGDGSKLDLYDRRFADMKAHDVFVMFASCIGLGMPVKFVARDGSWMHARHGADPRWAAWRDAVLDAGDQAAASLSYVDPWLWEVRLRHAENVFSHRNPYTGRTYAEEEAIALVEINNEAGHVRRWIENGFGKWPAFFRDEFAAQWTDWLRARHGGDVALRAAWGAALGTDETLDGPCPSVRLEPGAPDSVRRRDLQTFLMDRIDARNREYIAFCRSLAPKGVGVNVVPFSCDSIYRPSLPWLWADAQGDSSTVSMYFWENGSMLDRPPGFYVLDSHRVDGKLSVVYETGRGRPSRYRAEWPFMLAVLADWQDFDIVDWHGSWMRGASPEGLLAGTAQPPSTSHFWDAVHLEHDPAMMSAVALAGRLFLAGAVGSAPNPAIYTVGDDAIHGAAAWSGLDGPDMSRRVFTTGARIRFDPAQKGPPVQIGGRAPEPVPAPVGPVRTGRWTTWDWPRGRLVVDSPTAKVFVGPTEGGIVFSDGIALDGFNVPWTAFALVSRDGRPLAGGCRSAWVAAVFDARNTGLDYDETVKGGPTDQARAVRSRGHAPVVVDPVGYSLRLPGLSGATYRGYDFALREAAVRDVRGDTFVQPPSTDWMGVLSFGPRTAVPTETAFPASREAVPEPGASALGPGLPTLRDVASALDAPVPDGGLVLAFGAAPTYAELVAFLEGRLGPPASRKAAAGAFEESETRWTVPASGGGARTVRATEVQGVVRFFLRGANP